MGAISAVGRIHIGLIGRVIQHKTLGRINIREGRELGWVELEIMVEHINYLVILFLDVKGMIDITGQFL